MRPRVLIADDHALLLGAFETLLASECDVVGTVTDGRALVEAAQRLKPDVVVLDIAMPLLNGLDAGRQIKAHLPRTKLVFMTGNEDADLAAEAFRIGASAYILKRSAAPELLVAIREAMKGHSYVTSLMTDGLVTALIHASGSHPKRELTPREREVLQLLVEGRSMKEAAGVLDVSPRTVAFHKYRMMEKLGIKTNAELIQHAMKHHIV